MSLKQLQQNINFQTVRDFRKLLSEKKTEVLKDNEVLNELFNLKELLIKFEDAALESRSREAANELSQMTEEERLMLTMSPDEKKFFISFKNKNPDNPWSYFKEYQKKLQKEYLVKQKELS